MSTHLVLNRPIHLARRDVFFERAVEMLYMPLNEMGTGDQLKHVEKVLQLLKTAEAHASLAVQTGQASEKERDFLHFLKLILHNVHSVHAMMQHQAHLEAEESFLCQFLGAKPEQSALPAMAYRRRAEDILQGLWHLLRLAHTPYRSLQEENVNGLNTEDKERYKKACQSFRQELDK